MKEATKRQSSVVEMIEVELDKKRMLNFDLNALSSAEKTIFTVFTKKCAARKSPFQKSWISMPFVLSSIASIPATASSAASTVYTNRCQANLKIILPFQNPTAINRYIPSYLACTV
ncbi:hypothetical protein LCGC14_2369270, partial [marine sediment metagenome]